MKIVFSVCITFVTYALSVQASTVAMMSNASQGSAAREAVFRMAHSRVQFFDCGPSSGCRDPKATPDYELSLLEFRLKIRQLGGSRLTFQEIGTFEQVIENTGLFYRPQDELTDPVMIYIRDVSALALRLFTNLTHERLEQKAMEESRNQAENDSQHMTRESKTKYQCVAHCEFNVTAKVCGPHGGPNCRYNTKSFIVDGPFVHEGFGKDATIAAINRLCLRYNSRRTYYFEGNCAGYGQYAARSFQCTDVEGAIDRCRAIEVPPDQNH